jgi:hypothetical protein
MTHSIPKPQAAASPTEIRGADHLRLIDPSSHCIGCFPQMGQRRLGLATACSSGAEEVADASELVIFADD